MTSFTEFGVVVTITSSNVEIKTEPPISSRDQQALVGQTRNALRRWSGAASGMYFLTCSGQTWKLRGMCPQTLQVLWLLLKNPLTHLYQRLLEATNPAVIQDTGCIVEEYAGILVYILRHAELNALPTAPGFLRFIVKCPKANRKQRDHPLFTICVNGWENTESFAETANANLQHILDTLAPRTERHAVALVAMELFQHHREHALARYPEWN